MSHDPARAESLVRVARLQMEPKVGELEANIADSVTRIDAAAARGAQLIVLPELCSSGYVFETRDEAYALAEEVPHGPASRVWMQAAQRHRCWIVAGIAERAGAKLFNSAVLVGPEGHIETFRKMHSWAAEHLNFEPATSASPSMQRRSGASRC